jgi:hypothetical protein
MPTSCHDGAGSAETATAGKTKMATEVKTARLAQVNGIQLAYQTFGQGDPLILLYGGFGSEQREDGHG